jgi:8-amino-7-oxononanoate synthase
VSLPGLAQEAAAIRAAGRWRQPRTFDGATGARSVLDGREVLVFGSNDYLGLATHPEVAQAAQEAAARWGTGTGGSRLLAGSPRLHRELEEALATLKGTEDAVLFPSGYQANLGTLSALARPGDLLLSDALNHASIVDGCRLARAEVEVTPHADAAAVRSALASRRAGHRHALVVTDGVFSMDGDLAPLPELAEACAEHEAALVVDDAHGTGVLGRGRGTAHELGAEGVEVQVGTLSKALASQGGFVAGSRELCDHLRNTARPFIFSTSLSPPAAAAALAAVRLVAREPARVDRLRENAARLRTGLQRAGWQVPDGVTPIVPVLLGHEQAAMEAMRALEQAGIYAGAVRPPTVPPGSCRIRLTALATHTAADIDSCVEAFAALRKEAPA